ncbi:MAG: 30S ribosomal protein S3 [Myxococcales bacterium]|nr:30S ribosomal protein S3 [Myxococcales bacterium]
MGQKVHPIGFRLGITRTWDSRWYSRRDYAALLHEDIRIRKFFNRQLQNAGLSKIEIERTADKVKVSVFTSRPGIVIGKKGADIDRLRADIGRLTGKDVMINIEEIRKAETDATLVADHIAGQLMRRMAFRRVIRRSVQTAMKLGVQGIKVAVSGRLGGAEIARAEWYREGRVPLHTLRADIDYGTAEARTTYGAIGIKVWIFKGEVIDRRQHLEARDGVPEPKAAAPSA